MAGRVAIKSIFEGDLEAEKYKQFGASPGMVIYWVYNSGLVSVLTVDKVEWPIRSLKVNLY